MSELTIKAKRLLGSQALVFVLVTLLAVVTIAVAFGVGRLLSWGDAATGLIGRETPVELAEFITLKESKRDFYVILLDIYDSDYADRNNEIFNSVVAKSKKGVGIRMLVISNHGAPHRSVESAKIEHRGAPDLSIIADRSFIYRNRAVAKLKKPSAILIRAGRVVNVLSDRDFDEFVRNAP